MTMTTIKVPTEVRDSLKQQARQHGVTLGEHLQHLAAVEAKAMRMQAMREAMAANPPDDEYRKDLHSWESDAWD